jgi:hypothetical protein
VGSPIWGRVQLDTHRGGACAGDGGRVELFAGGWSKEWWRLGSEESKRNTTPVQNLRWWWLVRRKAQGGCCQWRPRGGGRSRWHGCTGQTWPTLAAQGKAPLGGDLSGESRGARSSAAEQSERSRGARNGRVRWEGACFASSLQWRTDKGTRGRRTWVRKAAAWSEPARGGGSERGSGVIVPTMQSGSPRARVVKGIAPVCWANWWRLGPV